MVIGVAMRRKGATKRGDMQAARPQCTFPPGSSPRPLSAPLQSFGAPDGSRSSSGSSRSLFRALLTGSARLRTSGYQRPVGSVDARPVQDCLRTGPVIPLSACVRIIQAATEFQSGRLTARRPQPRRAIMTRRKRPAAWAPERGTPLSDSCAARRSRSASAPPASTHTSAARG